MAGPILSSVLTLGGSGYSSTPPFNTGFIVQGGNASARFRVDSLTFPNAVLTYTVTNPGNGYITGAALTSADSAGSGFELNITAVASGGFIIYSAALTP